MVISRHQLAGAGEFPYLGKTCAQLLMIDADDVALDLAEWPRIGLCSLANLSQLFRCGLQRHEQADIVNHAGEKCLISSWQLHQPAQLASGDANSDAMLPQILGGESFAQFCAAKHLPEARRHRDIL